MSRMNISYICMYVYVYMFPTLMALKYDKYFIRILTCLSDICGFIVTFLLYQIRKPHERFQTSLSEQ